MTTNKRNLLLPLLALIIVVLPLLLLALTAAGVLVEGMAAEEESLHYTYQILTTISLLLIPLALRLSVFKRVKAAIQASPKAYLRMSLARLTMLALVIWLGAAGYVLFMESSMLWCCGVGLVAMFFIWPNRERERKERNAEC